MIKTKLIILNGKSENNRISVRKRELRTLTDIVWVGTT